MLSLKDLVVFNTEGWFGLYQTINSHYWPLQFVGLLWGLFTFYVFFKRKQALVVCTFVGLAALWLSSAVVFHFGEYRQLSWGAVYFGWAFIAQAGLLLVSAVLSRRFGQAFLIATTDQQINRRDPSVNVGYILLGAGILMVPILGLMEGRDWTSLDVLGVGPDSTALATIGLVLLATRSKALQLILCIAPTLWLIISAATAWPLALYQGVLSLLVWLLAGIFLLISKNAGS
jgi:hypothetical protein